MTSPGAGAPEKETHVKAWIPILTACATFALVAPAAQAASTKNALHSTRLHAVAHSKSQARQAKTQSHQAVVAAVLPVAPPAYGTGAKGPVRMDSTTYPPSTDPNFDPTLGSDPDLNS
jgi:hypothetical protein